MTIVSVSQNKPPVVVVQLKLKEAAPNLKVNTQSNIKALMTQFAYPISAL